VKLHSVIQYALALAASFLLAACGGGGASVNANAGGVFILSPAAATIYAGVPAPFTIQGGRGRGPYSITSSEPGILPVPPIVNSNTFDVIPNNPGVVDTGLPPGALQIRTITLEAHDSDGNSATSKIQVAQNFLTGYGLSFGQTTCPAPVGGAANAVVSPCAGGDTHISFAATFNGSLHGNEPFRLDVVRGQFAFFNPISSTNTVTPFIVVNSDHEGIVNAIIRVPAGVPSQLAVIRITDVGTGASTDTIFTIVGTSATLTLTAIPSSITFTGALSTQCGTGFADVFIFDGAPPYSALSSNPNVSVAAVTAGTQPGRFTISALNQSVCLTAVPVIFLDSLGNRTTVTVTTALGSATPAKPPALAVAPAAITLSCGTSGSVSVVGGTGVYSASSSSPAVSALVSGNTLTITRQGVDGVVIYPTASTVTVTDGSSAVSVDVTTQLGLNPNCP
jgi:hypothetical protein